MGKDLLFVLLSLGLMMHFCDCVFSSGPVRNFTLTGTTPKKIVLQSSGSKFLTWNVDSQIAMYNINGSVLCTTTYPQQIQRIIWPTEYYPILLPFPGLQFVTLNESNCQVIKNFNFRQITNMTNSTEEINEINFIWRNGGGKVALSGMVSIYQVDLSSATMVNAYLTVDLTGPRYQTTLYSTDFKYIYVVMTDANSGVRTVRVFKTDTLFFGKPILELSFNTSVSSMANSNDNSSIICVGSSPTTDSTTVYRFDNNGVVKSKTSRTGIIKSLTIGNGNAVALFQTAKGSMELVRAGDGQSIQNFTFSNSNYIMDADYQNKVLIILDNSNRVLTYSYTPDEDVQPIPNPVNPGQSFPVWAIVIIVIAGILILAVTLMYIFRQKLPESLRKKLPKCFNSSKTERKQPLLNEEQKVENFQPNPRLQPSGVIQSHPPIPPLYPNKPPEYQAPKKSQYQEGQKEKDGIPPGLTDAEIMQAMRKQQERRRQQQLQKRRRQELFERQERERKYRQEQQERQRRQYEYRRQKQWQEQQRLMEIERRRREDYEREKIRREREEAERIQRIRKEEEARKFYEYQKMEEERKRIELENKRQEEMRRIQYQRYLEDQERRKYQPYQSQYQPSFSQYPPGSQYQPSSLYQQNPSYHPNSQHSNPNIYVPPPPQYQQQYIPNVPIGIRQQIPEPRNFVDQRKNLIGRQEKPKQISQVNNNQDPDSFIGKDFFVVKRRDDQNDQKGFD